MKRASIRSFGIGLFIAGAVLQLQDLTQADKITSRHTINEDAYAKSQAELRSVKQQLAQLQLDLENAKNEQAPVKVTENTEKEEASTKSVNKSILVVHSGMNSKEISSTLELTGIIQNKQDFEDYLTSQNLTGRIQIGEHKLDSSMTIKQIAEKITGQ